MKGRISDFDRLRFLTTRKDKVALVILVFMTGFLSIIETIGIGAIVPFITFASNPSKILENKYSAKVYDFLGFSSPETFIFVFSVVLILFYLFRAGYSILYGYVISLFAYKKTHYFAFRMFQKLLRLNYADFVEQDADILRRSILTDSSNVSSYIRSFLLLYSELFTIGFLYSVLIAINWKMTFILTCFLSLKVFLITRTIGRRIAKKGEQRQKVEGGFLKILSTTFGNYKIIKIKDSHQQLEGDFLSQGLNRAKLEVTAQTLMGLPRHLLETTGFCILIACVVYILYKYQDANVVLPIVSMYTLALYKILPAVNKILDHFNTMKFNRKSLELIYNELRNIPEEEGNEAIEFAHTIRLENISFSYIPGKSIISDLNLVIHKGEKVAFVGKSGAGKSTLVDILSGFYTPKSGEIYIDHHKLTRNNIKAWRKKFGYIPQSIYLFSGSVGENIAFGSTYDRDRIIQACKIAKIYDFLSEHQGIDTQVGDEGIKLSGGQKQRIGIARAIYDNPEILVLDEATSALDNETESQIMDEIYDLSMDKTLIIIAHRLSTIERCERKIEFYPNSQPTNS